MSCSDKARSAAQDHEWEPHLTEDASTCRRCDLTVENTLRAAGWDEELVKTPCVESPAASRRQQEYEAAMESVWAALRDLAKLTGDASLAPVRDELRAVEQLWQEPSRV